jgi:hypothetical protein
VSVIPAIGATAKGDASSIGPIFMTGKLERGPQRTKKPSGLLSVAAGSRDECLVRLHISGVDFDTHALPNQIDG